MPSFPWLYSTNQLGCIHHQREGYFSSKDKDDDQSKFPNKLNSIDKSINSIEKKLFLRNTELFVTARKKFINTFKSRFFAIKNLEPIPEQELELKLELELKTEL